MTLATLHAWWQARLPRERALLQAAALLVTAALVWSVALAPAWRTVRAFDALHTAQEAQLQTMRSQQAQARTLQALPPVSATASTQALQASVHQAFGNQAELHIGAGTLTLTVHNVRPEALAQWLARARTEARAAPVQAHLVRSPGSGPVLWSGTLQLPAP